MRKKKDRGRQNREGIESIEKKKEELKKNVTEREREKRMEKVNRGREGDLK